VSVQFYFDVHVYGPAYEQLLARGVDVLRVQDDGRAEVADPDLLDRATELGRVIVTFDDDFLAEAHRRQDEGT
jgi:predicted nuclease of predicted toxin-antitoxin system